MTDTDGSKMSTCMICRCIFEPTKRLKDTQSMNNILSTCSKFLKPEVFQTPATWELSGQQNASPLCERCHSFGRKLSVLNDRLDEIQKEINTFVDQFTEKILDNFDECNFIKPDLDEIKVEVLEDELHDMDTDLTDMSDNTTLEWTEESDSLTFNNISSSKSLSNTQQFKLKRLCLKLERLQDSYLGRESRKNSYKRKSARKATLSYRKDDNIEKDAEYLIDGDIPEEDEYYKQPKRKERNRKRTPAKIKPSDQKEVLKFECSPCAVKFLSEEKLENHLKRHLEKPVKCTKCEKHFFTQWARKIHKKVHARKDNLFVCELCEESNFTCSYDLEVHILAHNDEIPFKCFSCGKSFSNSLGYTVHQQQSPCPVNDSNEPSDCGLCGASFKSKFTMLVHLSEHNKPNVGYKCPVCPKVLAKKRPLENHILSHVKDSPYACDICQRPVRTLQTLLDHRKTHKANPSFKCKHCDLSFGTKNCLVRHTFVTHTHTGEIFKCETCGWEFQIKDDYRRHLAIHSKPIICDFCGKAYNRMVDLKAHRRTHTGEMFSCANCEKRFVSPYLLNQHVATAHGIGSHLDVNEKVRNRIREKKKRVKTKSSETQS